MEREFCKVLNSSILVGALRECETNTAIALTHIPDKNAKTTITLRHVLEQMNVFCQSAGQTRNHFVKANENPRCHLHL